MHVDGFRFDLASVFTRNADGSINFDDPPIFSDIASDPALDRIRLIAEPWDAAGAYELGRAFPGITWLQWNGRFRDDVRRFMRGDGDVGALMQRLYGSDDLFPDDVIDAYHAYQSVNFVACHDGFTLHDLLAYEHKRNDANGHGNDDGPVENWSSNCGWEGDTGVPPQIAFRKQHPSLARSRFWRDDVRWFGTHGVVDLSPSSRVIALCLRGASQADDDLYVMVNADPETAPFVIQDVTDSPWRVSVDTSRASPEDIELTRPPILRHTSYAVEGRSVVVLVRQH